MWGAIAMIAGSVISGAGSDRGSRREIAADRDIARMQIEGDKEMQDDQQAFEEFLINRRNVAGGPAYGGSAEVPDFWFGMNESATSAGIGDFFANLNASGNSYSGGSGNRSRAPDVSNYSEAGQGDVDASIDYQIRDEFDNPLFNLRNFLNLDTRRGYNPDGQRANPTSHPGDPGPNRSGGG